MERLFLPFPLHYHRIWSIVFRTLPVSEDLKAQLLELGSNPDMDMTTFFTISAMKWYRILYSILAIPVQNCLISGEQIFAFCFHWCIMFLITKEKVEYYAKKYS